MLSLAIYISTENLISVSYIILYFEATEPVSRAENKVLLALQKRAYSNIYGKVHFQKLKFFR